MSQNLEYYRNQVSLARTEIKNLRQQLSSLKHEHLKEIQLIKVSLNKLSCASCAAEATTINTNGHTTVPPEPECISFKPIGVIETSFQNKRGVPRQPTVMTTGSGTVVIDTGVFNNPEHALNGLEEFSHMWIIFHFHVTESTSTPAKVSPPRLQGERRGVFSTRSPHRPCPIGLSLVKIVNIEGNKIHFQGVDMVNGTPVLDIKPYIPQYDFPNTTYTDTTMSRVMRPPTEGISDVADTVGGLTLNDNGRLNRLTNPVGTDTTANPRTPFEANQQSQENQNPLATPISPSPESPTVDITEGQRFRPRSPIRRPDSERGAPDGQERFTPPQSAQMLACDGIRVASWISNPSSQTFEVRFTDDALARLNELIGDRAQAFKANIETLLAEDPRSQYVRSRYPNHEYSCVLEDLSVTCVFDEGTSTCTIVLVRSAEELQQT